jgi:hypothetical protein
MKLAAGWLVQILVFIYFAISSSNLPMPFAVSTTCTYYGE